MVKKIIIRLNNFSDAGNNNLCDALHLIHDVVEIFLIYSHFKILLCLFFKYLKNHFETILELE